MDNTPPDLLILVPDICFDMRCRNISLSLTSAICTSAHDCFKNFLNMIDRKIDIFGSLKEKNSSLLISWFSKTHFTDICSVDIELANGL